jgi:hypothetical protein
MSEFGADDKPTIGTLTDPNPDCLDPLKADISQCINGRLIEAIYYSEKKIITIDGQPFNGTFTEAVMVAGSMPIRWSNMGRFA